MREAAIANFWKMRVIIKAYMISIQDPFYRFAEQCFNSDDSSIDFLRMYAFIP